VRSLAHCCSPGLIEATRVMRLAGEAETALEQGRSIDILGLILGRLTSAFSEMRPWIPSPAAWYRLVPGRFELRNGIAAAFTMQALPNAIATVSRE
jgi:hypothetical protein